MTEWCSGSQIVRRQVSGGSRWSWVSARHSAWHWCLLATVTRPCPYLQRHSHQLSLAQWWREAWLSLLSVLTSTVRQGNKVPFPPPSVFLQVIVCGSYKQLQMSTWVLFPHGLQIMTSCNELKIWSALLRACQLAATFPLRHKAYLEHKNF